MSNTLVCGVGVNQPGKYKSYINYKATSEYILWKNMLARCTPGNVMQVKFPSYIGCSVHQDFIHFQDFAAWCHDQIGFGMKGWALDKDVLIPGNRIYGPHTCVFIPRDLNNTFERSRVKLSMLPLGVSFSKRQKKFQANIRVDSTSIHLGWFDNQDDAHDAYKIAKTNEIHRQAEIFKSVIDPRVYDTLLNYRIE